MSKEMMICKLGHTIPLSSPICDDRCSDYHLRRGKCINLIPYIVEQPKKPATCPECGHPVSEHRQPRTGDECLCPDKDEFGFPADLQPATLRFCNEGHTIPLEEDSELCRGACPDIQSPIDRILAAHNAELESKLKEE